MPAEEQPRYETNKKLLKVRGRVVKLGRQVEENLSVAHQAVIGDRPDLIAEVIAADKDIDKSYAKLDRMTFMAIAQQKPDEADLRFLVSSTRLGYELERCGDLVVNIVAATKRIKGLPDSPKLRELLDKLFEETGKILERSMEVFDALDAAGGAALDEEDDVIDDLTEEFNRVIKAESDDIGLDAGIALNRVARFLERIADHAVNVGINTVYIVTGELPRRPGAKESSG